MRNRILCWLSTISLLAGCGPKVRAHRQAELDPWSEARLQASLDELIPLVEEAAGRDFLERPKVAVADEGVFRELLMAEQMRIYAQVMPDTPLEIRQQLAEAAGAFMSSGILGKYILETETVYVCPSAILPAMDELGLDASRTGDVISVVVAHEITHALQDQYTDLDRVIDNLHDEEALWAASGAWEGFATLIEERVALGNGLDDVYWGLLELQGWGPEGLTDVSAWRTWAIYGQGRDFMHWHDARGGIEAAWATLNEPPVSTSMLFRPETYTAQVADPELDYAAILRGVEQELSEGDWLVTNSRLGEFDLRGEATRAGNQHELDRILGHLEYARRLDVARPDRSGGVRLLVFDDETWPRAYLALLRAQQTHESLETALVFDLPVEVSYETFDEVEADDAVLRVERIPLVGTASEEKRAVWVVRDEVLVVVEANRFRPGEALGETVEAVFDRLEAARAVKAIID